MVNRVNEEEKHEKIIRNLLKQSGNKKCINCGSLGPQYVCTTFWIFVCTACSGMHREFTHRVKSVSMAKFTAAEVADLQAGGNERARMLYFKDWDPHRHPLPDNSNPEKLRSFIKNVYEERRYTGEKSAPRGRQSDREESDYPRRFNSRTSTRSVPQSPSYEDRYEDRSISNKPAVPDRDLGQSNGYRFNEEEAQYRYSNGLDRRFENRFTNYETQEGRKGSAGSSNRKEQEEKSLQAGHVKGNHRTIASSLHTKNPLQKNGFPHLVLAPVDSQKSSSRTSNFESSGSGQPSTAIATSVLKRADSFSLIDLSAEPEIPAQNGSSDPVGITSINTASETSSDTGWANFDSQATADSKSSSASSNNHGDFFASTNVGGQSIGESDSAITSSVHVADNWASFGGQMQPLPLSIPFPEFPQVPSVRSPTGRQQVKLQQDEKIVVSSSSSNSHPSEKRQPIPEDFFVSLISSPAQTTRLDLGIQNSSQTSQFPQLGVSAQITLPLYGQLSTSMNPFDLPGESSSQPVANGTFPSLASFQAAFPPAWSEDEISGIGNLPPAQLPFLAVVPTSASYPQGSAAYDGKASGFMHPTMQDRNLKDNDTGFAAIFGLFPSQTLNSQTSLPATAINPFG